MQIIYNPHMRKFFHKQKDENTKASLRKMPIYKKGQFSNAIWTQIVQEFFLNPILPNMYLNDYPATRIFPQCRKSVN